MLLPPHTPHAVNHTTPFHGDVVYIGGQHQWCGLVRRQTLRGLRAVRPERPAFGGVDRADDGTSGDVRDAVVAL